MKIEIEKVLRDKNPRLARFTPRFLLNYLRRIVHEREINEVLEQCEGLRGADFARKALSIAGIGYTARGLESLDGQGRYLFVSNHPFGGVDGMMLIDLIEARFSDVRVVVNDLLMNIAPLSPIFIPVNKHGRQNDLYARNFNDAFGSDIPILTFPAGLVSRRIGGRVTDLDWRPSFVKRAVASRRDIVPVYIDGRLSDFFYRLASVRKKLGIKANIEMLYLADEMFRQRGSRFEILFGEPVPWQTLCSGASAAATAAEIRKRVYELGTRSGSAPR